MTNDSSRFLTRGELVAQGWQESGLKRWRKGDETALPLLVGKSTWHFDHRANHANVNAANIQVASSSEAVSPAEHADPAFVPEPQYWVHATAEELVQGWALAFRDITNPTNARTAIAAIVPHRIAGNTLPLLLHERDRPNAALSVALLLANMNALIFDYVTRQKAKWTHLNWFILEQLPVIAPGRFDEPLPAAFAAHMRGNGLMNGHHPQPTVADFISPQVLALSYTAHDLAPFARDLGYLDEHGELLPPVRWDDEDRRRRRTALDAVFFHLYGLEADDTAYVLDTFPIVREQDEKACGEALKPGRNLWH